MRSDAHSVARYLAELPAERREAIAAVPIEVFIDTAQRATGKRKSAKAR